MPTKKKTDQPAQQGVPKETPRNNCFAKLSAAIAPTIGEASSRKLVAEIKRAGYFDLGLLDQSRLIVAKVVALGNGAKISRALLNSDSDKIRSLGIHVHFEHFKHDLGKELKSLKYTGALPGTWTQETAQWVLKNVIHEHSLEIVLPLVRPWASNKDPAVRRMVAEALRPRGVWCKHLAVLKHNPTPIKTVLERLLDDKSDYVRKAVANNLNDISKDNPDLLCDWIDKWCNGKISPERQWIIQRALRTLIKSGHPRAQKLMGLGDANAVEIVWLKGTPSEIAIGQSIPFEFQLKNTSDQPHKLRLQLVMIGPGKNNKPRLAKYILGVLEIVPKATAVLSKRVKFTHKNFVPKLPGIYQLQVFSNGKKFGERSTKYLGKDL